MLDQSPARVIFNPGLGQRRRAVLGLLLEKQGLARILGASSICRDAIGWRLGEEKPPKADGENQVPIKSMLKPDGEKRPGSRKSISENKSADKADRHSLPMEGGRERRTEWRAWLRKASH